MSTNLRKLIIRMSRLAMYATTVCMSLTMVFAAESIGQRKLLKDIPIEFTLTKTMSLQDLIDEVESSGKFTFVYSRRDIRGITLAFDQPVGSMEDLLNEISIQARVSIKRVNETISFKNVVQDAAMPQVFDEVPVQVSISGKVTDENGEALIGAAVLEKGTTNGTITDIDGNYQLTVGDGAVLQISFVGYQSIEVPVNNRTTINPQLQLDTEQLDEIVVVGYGTVRKSDVTGSVSSIDTDKLQKEGVNSIDQLLQNAASGVQVVQNSAEPGGGISIQIRGSGSINAGTAPLYVIDGLPIDNGSPVTGGGSGFDNARKPRNPLSTLNPADVESIEILKDASATAIYGARGANGVILITTKKGQSGDLKINYEGYGGVQNVLKRLDILNAQEYMTAMNEIQDAGGAAVSERVTGIVDGGTDWQEHIYSSNAAIQSHNISFSGGNDKTNFFTSFGYFDQEGVVKNSSFTRYTARLNISHKASEQFNMGVNLTTSYTFDDYISGGFGTNESAGVLYAAFNWDPTETIYNSDGTYFTSPFINTDNPLALIYGEQAVSNKYRTFGTVFGEYNFTPEFKARVNIGGDMNYQRRDVYIDKSTITGSASNGIASILQGMNSNYLVEGLLSYNKDFNENQHFDALVGVTTQKFIYDDVTTVGEGFVSDVTKTYNIGSGDPTLRGIGSSKTDNKLLSYLARVNYSLFDKYLFTSSFRVDGSSRFGENNKFGYFPSFAFAWRADQESFLSSFEQLSTLKVRTSWGQTGNQAIGNFQSLTTFSNGPEYVYDDQLASSQQPSRFSNPDLKWETTEQINFGVDFGFFEDRISGGIDYFIKNTYDMLLDLPVPTTTGFNTRTSNVGSVRNSGFELSILTRNLVNEFSWSTSANLTALRNEVIDLGGIPEIITGGAGWANQISIIREGEPVYSFYGYEIEGVWQQNDDFASTNDNVSPGDFKYRDINGDSTVNADDRTILGNSIPKLFYSLGNNFSYKQFSLDILIEGVHGVSMYNNNLAETYFPISFRRNRYAEPILNRWTPENPSNEYPSFVDPLGQGQKYVNSYTVEDASYLRVKNIRFSYQYQPKSAFIGSATFFVSAVNLLTFTNYQGLDPSINPNGNADLRVDFNAYPNAISLMFGINLSL